MSEACIPIFSSLRETLKPSTSLPSESRMSTMNRLIPSWPASGSVLATSTM